MKTVIWGVLALTLLLTNSALAQVSAGVYGGLTTPTPSSSTFMVMGDYGTKVDVEPWIQSFGKEVQVGADVIFMPKGPFGLVVGAYTNKATARYGAALNILKGQVRVMRTNEGTWQGIGLYNFYLTPKTYVQVWAAPAQGGSSYLVGVGHTFRE